MLNALPDVHAAPALETWARLVPEVTVDKNVIGVLHPGEMGAAVGACLTQRGLTVLWASAGRSPATADRAAAAGMRDVGSASEMSGQADVILSVCPPHAALEVARSVSRLRRHLR